MFRKRFFVFISFTCNFVKNIRKYVSEELTFRGQVVEVKVCNFAEQFNGRVAHTLRMSIVTCTCKT